MKRLLLVYNPRSSHFWQVKKELLTKIRELKGWMIGKFEVADTNVDDNAARLAKVIMDDDLVVSAGGDGTANIAMNGIMLAKKKNVRLGVMSFGNFNDMARNFGSLSLEEILKGDAKEYWPLDCRVNKEHWRYGLCYFTFGMFAEACAVFDHSKVRKRLQKGKRHLFQSLVILVRWWFKQHRRRFLPKFKLGSGTGEYVNCDCSDYMAINSRTVARIMKGDKKITANPQYFLSYTGKMNKFWPLSGMMIKSFFHKIPGIENDYDCLLFEKPAKMMAQAEGEYKILENVRMLEVRKSERPILVIAK